MFKLKLVIKQLIKDLLGIDRERLKSVKWYYTTKIRRLFGYTMNSTREYGNYRDYVRHQKEKTTDSERIRKWQGEEWQIKLEGFRDIFERNWPYIKGKNQAICLGARTGQEVKALRDLGVDAIGVDLVAFPPYTVEGDIHDLKYPDEHFDFVFTNIFDHALYPEKFCSEMERVLRPSGVVIIHLMVGHKGDQYTETVIYDVGAIKQLFKYMDVLADRDVKNTFDEMNRELILRKK